VRVFDTGSFQYCLMLNFLEVTGRSTTHVRDVVDPPCLLHAQSATALLAMRNAGLAAGIELNVVSGSAISTVSSPSGPLSSTASDRCWIHQVLC
jgi:hypothetical protein